MIVQTNGRPSNGLGFNPALITTGASVIGRILGGSSAKQTYPWRVRPVEGKTGVFEIVYGTNYKWYPVWTGPLEQIFGGSGFDVSGNTDRGKWRATRTGETVTVMEYVNSQWNTVDQVTLTRLIEAYGYVPKFSQPAPTGRTIIPAGQSTIDTDPVMAMTEPARTGTAWLIGLAVGVLLWFGTRNAKG